MKTMLTAAECLQLQQSSATPCMHVSSAPKGDGKKKTKLVLPAFVSLSPLSLDFVFSSSAYMASSVKLKEVDQRDLTCKHHWKILSAYLSFF